MKRLIFAMGLVVVSACASWDYAKSLQDCIDNNVGDPAAREACLCNTAKDAGRTCDFLNDSDAGDGAMGAGANQ